MRSKGKISFNRYFQKFNIGDSVAIVRELSEKFGYVRKLQGRTGKVIGKRGNAYHLEINDFDKKKKYLIKPVHLKKIENEISK